ncbi:MAG: YiiX/YebB-like N1pC/P60 family cysteine hydrolase [Bryobacteraceae bacterium]
MRLRVPLLLWGFLLLSTPAPPGEAPPGRLPLLQPGDILLRRGRSLVSSAVLRAAPDSAYSHAGIVVGEAGRLFVVEADPEPGSRNGGVVITTVEEFLSPKNATAWKVLRLRGTDRAIPRAAARAALAWVGRPFDGAFRLDSDDSLYCTELVWRSYLAAGVNILTQPPASVRLGLLHRKIIVPGDLERSHRLAPVLAAGQ